MATQHLAAVTIGCQTFLMSRTKAVKVIELMGDAVDCRKDYDTNADFSRRWRYVVSGPPDIELSFVDPDRVVMPEGASTPAPGRRRSAKAITRQPLRLDE